MHSTWYSLATIWLVDVKSRRPPVKANEMTPKMIPNPAPIRTAEDHGQPVAALREQREQQPHEQAEPGAGHSAGERPPGRRSAGR